jgi:hypothetical protein
MISNIYWRLAQYSAIPIMVKSLNLLRSQSGGPNRARHSSWPAFSVRSVASLMQFLLIISVIIRITLPIGSG